MNTSSTYSIINYQADQAPEWNRFVAASRNATFLFDRGYMDYHADRFADRSLMIYRNGGDKQRLVALFAACDGGAGVISAHAGLTYGGLVMPYNGLDGGDVADIMDSIAGQYRAEGYRTLRYKPVPHIYHRYPGEDDIYALFRHGARLAECNLSSCIELDCALSFNENSRRNMRHALDAGLVIEPSDDFTGFWTILEKLLSSRYNTRPVHTCDEIRRLASRFPEAIRLICARDRSGGMVAGTVLYITPRCVHTQYIAASPEGKASGALPLLFDHVIRNQCDGARYLDFGTSNEDCGRYLNRGLLRQKNGMGGRGITYNIYEIDL